MNKIKQMVEKRDMLRRIRHTSLVGSKTNNFIAYMSESENHIRLKFETWLKLRKENYEVLCEPIFNNGIRFDLLAYRDGIWCGYEILSSETSKQLATKIKNYPDINIVAVKTKEDVENLEMY